MEATNRMGFYKTQKFKDLKKEWYEILKETGFEDCEQESNGKDFLRVWHSSYFQTRYTKDSFRSKANYYRMAARFLHIHKFKDKKEKAIWLLHSEGLSLRDIAVEVGSNKDTVNAIVKNLSKLMRVSIGE